MTSPSLEAFRMSPQQRQMWSSWAAGDRRTCRAVLAIEGNLKQERLQRALGTLTQRHESLRTVYRRQPGMKWPLQILLERLCIAWFETEEAVVQPPPLDAEAGPVLAASLLRRSAETYQLTLDLLPLAADVSSLLVLVQELAASYRGLEEGSPSPELSEEPLQYVQFSEWQLEVAEEAAQDELPAELITGAESQHPPLPLLATEFDTAGEAGKKQSGSSAGGLGLVQVPWSQNLAELLTRRAAEAEISERAWVLTSWQAFLAALSGEQHVRVDVQLDGRKFEEFDRAVGRFARRAPLRLESPADFTFKELAQRTQRHLQLAEDHQELLGNQDAQDADAVVFQSAPDGRIWRAGDVRFTWVESRGDEWPLLFGLRVLGAPAQGCELIFDRRRVSSVSAQHWATGLGLLLATGLERPETQLRRLPRIGREERDLLQTTGGLPDEPIEAESLLAAIAAQAKKKPQDRALVGPSLTTLEGSARHRQVTYEELWQEAGALARVLRHAGVGGGDLVGLMLERSVETVISMLGIWRAGAAYLPLDSALPANRLAEFVDSAGARTVVTQKSLEAALPGRCSKVMFGRWDVSSGDHPALPNDAKDRLAYVLFTSGSTGRAKGVLVDHRSIASYVAAAARRLEAGTVDRWAMVSTLAADLGLTGLLLGLVNGDCVHLFSAQEAADPGAFSRRMSSQAIEGLKIVPSHLGALLSAEHPERVLPSKLLVLGGEACPPELVRRIRELAPDLRVFNHYGPTETTVGVVAGEVIDVPEPAVPLGRALDHAFFVLQDRWGEVVSSGVTGELCLGGYGVARGYLGQPVVTAERFVPDAWSGAEGGRLYRSGDRARLDAEGRLFFLGRVDHQVKVRGFRVELGEIESSLRRHEAVRQAVVVLQEDGRVPSLIAYVVQRPGNRLPATELQEHLSSLLPEYMIPKFIVTLDALPINENGKIDRQGLPAAEGIDDRRSHVEPRTEVERSLATLWEQALGVDRVGIEDDFFALGGDSILAIQLIGRAGREGLSFTPQQLFEQRNIEQLAPWVTLGSQTKVEQGPVVGEFPLTPIQHWFFGTSRKHYAHFNQSVLLAMARPLDAECLRRVLAALIEHHDILRARFVSTESGRRQAEILPESELSWAEHDLSTLPEGECRERLESLCAAAQEGFDVASGDLFRALSFDLGEAGGRLLLVSHHLLVDGVSWRVLLSDLESAYRQLIAEEELQLPLKSTGFLHWSKGLTQAVADGRFDDQLEYWREVSRNLASPLSGSPGGGPVGSAQRVVRSLDREQTRALLQEVPPVYNTQINDALLTALTLAHGLVHEQAFLGVEMEGHGREAVLEGVELSRTVGWFTTHFPVLIDLDGIDGLGAALVHVKETLRAVPQAGIGYGLLRWLGEGEQYRELRDHLEPQVSFNYLGQFDAVLEEDTEMRLAPEFAGPERAADEARSRRWEVSGSVLGGQLQLAVTYSPEIDDAASVERWLEETCRLLNAIVEHCRDPEAGGFSPSDFPLADLAPEDLDQLSALMDDLDADLGIGEAGS